AGRGSCEDRGVRPSGTGQPEAQHPMSSSGMSIIRLTFLGTSAAAPTLHRNVSGLAFKADTDLLLFDCGDGSQRQMIRFGTGYVVEEKTRPGRFDPEQARALGVPAGPAFGRLQKGETLSLDDGTQVKPEQVMGGARPGRKVVISGDTRPCPALISASAGADLL